MGSKCRVLPLFASLCTLRCVTAGPSMPSRAIHTDLPPWIGQPNKDQLAFATDELAPMVCIPADELFARSPQTAASQKRRYLGPSGGHMIRSKHRLNSGSLLIQIG